MSKVPCFFAAAMLAFAIQTSPAADILRCPRRQRRLERQAGEAERRPNGRSVGVARGRAGRDSQDQGLRGAAAGRFASSSEAASMPWASRSCFVPQDSGTEQCPITYLGDPGNRPIICGGRQITGWKKQGDRWIAQSPR